MWRKTNQPEKKKKKGSAGLIIWMVSRFLKLPQKQFIRNCPNQIVQTKFFFFFWRSIIIFSMMSYQPPPLPSSESKSIYKKGKKETENRAKRREKRRSFCVHAWRIAINVTQLSKKKKKKSFFLNKWLKMINSWKRNIKREMERRRAGSGLLVCCKLTTAVIEYLRTTQHWLHRPWSLRTW